MSNNKFKISKITQGVQGAITKSTNSPFELFFNSYDNCIYLQGLRWVPNYVVVDTRSNSASTISINPSEYTIVSPGKTIMFNILNGFINEFVIESTGIISSFCDNNGNAISILWQNGTAPTGGTSRYQYSITYNSATQIYLGAWAEFK